MAAMTNLLVKDDASTRVEQTLVPITDTPKPLWRSQMSNVPFEGQVTLEAGQEVLKSGDRKFTLKLALPSMETLSSGTSAGYVAAPSVAYEDVVYVNFIASKRGTVDSRANLLSILVGLLQGATSTTATGTLSQASAGGAFKGSAAPMPQFLINGVLPN
jgi:hypothetical protein